MKTKTFSILFALVMILSLSVGVFAEDYSETWDENTVLTVFSDMDLVFPDLFAPDDSAFLWEEGILTFPKDFKGDWRKVDDSGNSISKAPVLGQEDYFDELNNTDHVSYAGEFTFDPCGDGLIRYRATILRDNDFYGYYSTSVGQDKYGPEKVTFIRDIKAKVTVTPVNGTTRTYEATVKKCLNPENCHLLVYNRNGEAKFEGYLYIPEILRGTENISVDMLVYTSNYKTALWDVPFHYFTVTGQTNGTADTGTVAANWKQDYCQASLREYSVTGKPDTNLSWVRAKYDENTGEARFQATIQNFAQESNRGAGYKARVNYVIPADVIIPVKDVYSVRLSTCELPDPAEVTGIMEYWEDTRAFWASNGYSCTDPIHGIVTCSTDVKNYSFPVNQIKGTQQEYLKSGYFTCDIDEDRDEGAGIYWATYKCEAQDTSTIDGLDLTTGILPDRAESLASFGYKCVADPDLTFVDDTRDYLDRYTDYTCKYTVYNNANGHPYTDYCKFGEGIALGPNAIIRFDITIDHLAGKVLRAYPDGVDIPFMFRVGGMTNFAGRYSAVVNGVPRITFAAFEAVDFPCPYLSRMQVKNPLLPFATFYLMDPDPAIKPSGAYGTYEGGLWGFYQKCGKYAYMAVRLFNDGTRDEIIDLSHTPVAINGGTPMSWNWILSSEDAWKGKIVLEPGRDVIMIGRAKVTDIPAQMNADSAMTGAVNFVDFGFYITGKVFSDHNNTNCVLPPQ